MLVLGRERFVVCITLMVITYSIQISGLHGIASYNLLLLLLRKLRWVRVMLINKSAKVLLLLLVLGFIDLIGEL